MKLIEKEYLKLFLKGTIILFLFLHIGLFVNAQKYILKIIPDKFDYKKLIHQKSSDKIFSDSSLVYAQLQKIKFDLFSKGYIAASFDSIIFDSVYAKAYLFIGKKYRINKLNIKGIYPSLMRKYHISNSGKQLKKSINPVYLPYFYNQIIKEYENTGFPFATLIPEKVNIKDSVLELNLLLERNKLVKFNRLIIKGNVSISPEFLKRYLSFFEGDNYNEELINSVSSKIETLTFLNEIRSPEIDFFDNKADLYLYLKPRKANLFNGVAGFLPDKNNENKLSFTGNADLNLLNNFGKGENIFLKWSRTAKLSQKLDAGFALPYIFKSPFSIQTQFNLDKRDTSFIKISGKFGVDFNFKNNDKITTFVRKKQSLPLSTQFSDTSIFKKTSVLLFGLAYKSEKYDYKFNPSRAYFFEAGFAGGNRNVTDEEHIYYEANFSAEYYHSIFKNFVLKVEGNTRYAFPDIGFYENELFDLGGFRSLRGFDENRFKTSAYSVLNIEQRYLYEKNSNVFLFFNVAAYKDNLLKNTIVFPYGFGAGTNLSTKAGIFSIVYALGTVPGNYLQFSDSKIHIGYVNRF